jgi:ribosomal protein S18 acetylase RimI-like enzyme
MAPDPETLLIERAVPADAAGIVRVHHAAVHGTAAAFYPAEVLASWASLVTLERVEELRDRIEAGEELYLVVRCRETIVGFGAIEPGTAHLQALYVDPACGRRGIGGRLLLALEDLARSLGLDHLRLAASLNAEAFYARHGYEVVRRGTHRLPSGQEMACGFMRKTLHRSPSVASA